MRHVGSVLLIGSALGAAACGKVQTYADAAQDPPPDAVASGTVNVTTYTRSGSTGTSGAVQAGVDIVVVGGDGSVRDTGVTDSAGEATLDLQAGDTVTAIYPRDNGAELVSYLAAKPGDHLRFGETFGFGGAQTATMTVNWPAFSGSGFNVYHPCGPAYGSSTQTSTTLFEYDTCARSPFDALFIAWDLNNTSYIARWGLLENLTFQDGTSATLNTWQVPGSFTIGANGLPPEVTSANVEASPVLDGARGPRVDVSAAPSGGMVQATRPWAVGGEGIAASAGFYRAGSFGPQGTFEQLPASTTQWIAESPVRLPWFGQVIANAAARQITWITDGEGTYDGMVIRAQWSKYGVDGGYFDYNWTFFVPPGVSEIRYPELPAALMPYVPQDEDLLYAFGAMIDHAADADYDALRARAEWEIGLFNSYPDEQLWVSISGGVDRVPAADRPHLPAGWLPSTVLAP